MSRAIVHRRDMLAERLHVLLAVVIVLGSQAMWWFWLHVAPVAAGPSMSEPPRIVLLPDVVHPASHTETRAEGLWVGSPVLFALPHVMGFSQPFITEAIGLQPPLDTRVELSLTLQRPESFQWPAGAIELDALRQKTDVAHRRLPLTLRGDPVFPPEPVGTRRVPRIVIRDGLDGRTFERTPLDVVQALNEAGPWEAELYIEVDESGIVRRVLLEGRPADSALASALVRAVYTWRMTPAEIGAAGRVYVSAGEGPQVSDTRAGRGP